MDANASSTQLTVFLVEDSASLRRRIAALLHTIAGVRVVGEAEEIPAALRGIAASRPDVVITDLRLPGASGLELISALARRGPPVVMVVLTNQSSRPFRDACLAAGAHYFFDKTNEIDKAHKAIERLAEARSRRPTL
ncbi:response regulator [Paraburkholderia tagetis]|uniref:Response regulator transcription factor n=1 Tax=Paraburkholderia tagetis TaxID=2913261 RepID=A0A9X1RMT3_9BURK|nr:response regulator transcription factor [Paraburkholderia tagetis]MCG5073385.1 response regulator transcription factor [Paraburkholderia tagetis]